MQVNNINTAQSFGTKCLIGKTSAQKGLKNYSENLSKGIYNTFKKLSKTDSNDTFTITLGSLKNDKANTYMKMSYFDEAKKLKSSVNFNMATLKDYTQEMFSTLVSGTYSLLKESSLKTRNLTELCAETATNAAKQTSATINKLTKEFGFDDTSLIK